MLPMDNEGGGTDPSITNKYSLIYLDLSNGSFTLRSTKRLYCDRVGHGRREGGARHHAGQNDETRVQQAAGRGRASVVQIRMTFVQIRLRLRGPVTDP